MTDFDNTLSTFVSLELDDETIEYELIFTYDYEAGRPAYISGLPENCYPADPEEFAFNNIQIRIADNFWIPFPDCYSGDVFDALETEMRIDIDKKNKLMIDDEAERRFDAQQDRRLF